MSIHKPFDEPFIINGENEEGNTVEIGASGTNGTPRLNVESRNTDTYNVFHDILKELRILNKYNALITNVDIKGSDIL